MNLNKEHNFGVTPTVNIPRSAFLLKPERRTTFNAGLLIPVYVNQDIMPGDTFSLDFTGVIRQLTPVTPTMDNAVWDIYAFFQRSFYLWNHFKEFMGENPNGAWTDNQVEYTIPQIQLKADLNCFVGDLLNYMGIPLTSLSGDQKIEISRLPSTMYIQIWNNFFRNQNVQAPAYEPLGDATTFFTADSRIGQDQYDNWFRTAITTSTSIQRHPAPTNRLADYFSCAAIQPQKGSPVTLPLGTSAPVEVFGTGMSLGWQGLDSDGTTHEGTIAETGNTIHRNGSVYGEDIGTYATGGSSMTIQKAIGITTDPENSGLTGIADLSNAISSTVNALRLSFATQKILERDIFGTRLFEIYKNFFHVTSPYAVQQIPEYLGGCRVQIEQTQVAQTSSTDAVTPQGNVAAYSLTATNKHLFTKSFTEHGVLMIVMTVRTKNSYDQGIARQWSRKRRLDYYWPQLANIGYQAIKNKEIFADGTSNDEETFGYCPHWDELRTEMNINSGLFSGGASGTLNYWHYGDHYSTLPTLSAEWSASPAKVNIGRTLAVQNQHQYMLDALITINAARPIPTYSVPGLIDHF